VLGDVLDQRLLIFEKHTTAVAKSSKYRPTIRPGHPSHPTSADDAGISVDVDIV